ncbi:hypothetical protein DSO57_1014738 [Entomophthora muscae]|uniref:Uncharacterized protein n=1 Tax=Entomophthora muscae TaxID=34485 RepID=A0ACC2U3F9_9FUNG|nr:hypothetical protein DSO57_1014738 [Entomophthora muscae]
MSDLKKRNVQGPMKGKVDPCCDTIPLKPNNIAKPKSTQRGLSLKKAIITGLSWIFGVIGINLLISYLLTETLTYGYKNRYTNWRTYFPVKQRIFTEEELALYDGSDLTLPIYIAINGEVYDVSKGATYYGKGGGYSFFAGKDAARAYVTGCFKTHLTHDLRGFDDIDMEQVTGWMDFYRDHETYYRVGTVVHPPIDPESPIPEDCKDEGKRRSSETIQNANK